MNKAGEQGHACIEALGTLYMHTIYGMRLRYNLIGCIPTYRVIHRCFTT